MSEQGLPDEQRSFRAHFVIATALLVASSLWMLVDEVWIRRPWKDVQQRYLQAAREDSEKQITRLEQALASGGAQHTKIKELHSKIDVLEQQLSGNELQAALRQLAKEQAQIEQSRRDLQNRLTDVQSSLQAAYYRLRQSRERGDNDASALAEVERLESQGVDLGHRLARLSSREAELQPPPQHTELRALKKELHALQRPLALARRRLTKLQARRPEIVQIVVPALRANAFGVTLDQVDRCPTCHLSVVDRSVGEGPLLAPHPRRETSLLGEGATADVLLRQHPAKKFGCSTCHGGQGVATTATDAHGWPAPGSPAIAHIPQPMLRGAWLESRCRSCHMQQGELAGAPALSRGLKLHRLLGCTGCHRDEGQLHRDPIGPDLRPARAKLSSAWVVDWLQRPHALRPLTRMPDFALSANQALSAAAFLASPASAGHEAGDPGDDDGDPACGDVQRGRELLTSAGCAGCHRVDDRAPPAWPGIRFDRAPDLTRLAAKIKDPAWLVRWIRDPSQLAERPRMPNLGIQAPEARDLVAALLRDGACGDGQALRPDPAHLSEPAWIDRGRRLIEDRGCFACHRMAGVDQSVAPAPSLAGFGSKPLEMLDFGETQGPAWRGPRVNKSWRSWTLNKLRRPRLYETVRIRLRMPDYGLHDDEVRDLAVYLKSLAPPGVRADYRASHHGDRVSRLDAGRQIVERLGCQGCHSLDGVTGGIAARYPEPALAPPSLKGEGLKVQSAWLHRFLQKPQVLRPWLRLRMPRFDLTSAEAEALVAYLYALDGVERLYDFNGAPEQGAALCAQTRTAMQKLKCAQCHALTLSPGLKAADLAPDLRLAGRRLRYPWMLSWLRDPQKVLPGTRMPTYFPLEDDEDPSSLSTPLPNFLGGRVKDQIRNIAATVMATQCEGVK